jgi:curved DNA-binding protein
MGAQMTATDAGREQTADLYRVLGVEPCATTAEIARAYRRLARRYHPDVDDSDGAAERFAHITQAYRVLSDPGARARYDASRAVHRSATLGPSARTQSGRSRGTTSWPRAETGADGVFWLGAPSFLSHAFDLGADVPRRSTVQEEETELELSVEEAYHGTSRTVTVTSRHATDSVRVAIPPGAVTGQRIEVPLTHLAGSRPPPPVILRVRLAPHERYHVDGRHVHLELPLAPWEAALGATVPLDTPAGPTAVDVPPGTSTGHVLTLPGHGIPNPAGPPGDLCVHTLVVVPAELTPAERNLFERLAAASMFNPRTSTTRAR